MSWANGLSPDEKHVQERLVKLNGGPGDREKKPLGAERQPLETSRVGEKELEEAKEIIIRIIINRKAGGKHIMMIGFDEFESLEPMLTPDLVRAVIRKFPGELIYRTLRSKPPGGPGRAGVGLAKPPSA